MRFSNLIAYTITSLYFRLDIHFIHAKPKSVAPATKVYPILLLHGWPGSVREFYEIIQHLITPKDNIVFEVIAPSLPGYGWSQVYSINV